MTRGGLRSAAVLCWSPQGRERPGSSDLGLWKSSSAVGMVCLKRRTRGSVGTFMERLQQGPVDIAQGLVAFIVSNTPLVPESQVQREDIDP